MENLVLTAPNYFVNSLKDELIIEADNNGISITIDEKNSWIHR